MGRVRAALTQRRRAIIIGMAAVVACVGALGAGRALTPPAGPPGDGEPVATSRAALARLDAPGDPLASAAARARSAIAGAAAALADHSARRGARLAEARDAATTARLDLLALEEGASDDERRSISAANRGLQRLVLRLDTASREG